MYTCQAGSFQSIDLGGHVVSLRCLLIFDRRQIHRNQTEKTEAEGSRALNGSRPEECGEGGVGLVCFHGRDHIISTIIRS
jgi:hypothetical protein